MAAGISENCDTHSMPPGVAAPAGIYVVAHRDPAHTGPHEVRIASAMVLPECNICRRVRFSRKGDIIPPIEDCEFFPLAAAVVGCLNTRPRQKLENKPGQVPPQGLNGPPFFK